MKKIYIAFMTVAALAAISCNTKEEYGSLPAGEVMFTAVQADNPESKTILQSDGSVFWSADDSINLFFGTAGSAKLISNNSEPAQQTTFSGSLGGYNHNGSDYFHAVYPYSAENTFDGTAFTVTLPEVQNSVAGSFADDLFISMARSQNYTLQFYNLCGGVKFSVAEAGIKYVTFKGNNNEPLAGKVNVIFNDDGKPVVQTVVDGKTELRLDAPNGGTFEPGEWYYIVSLPAILSAGYTMTFYKDEKYAERITDSSITIKRAVWGRLTDADDIPDITPPNNEIWYTSTDGQIVEPTVTTGFGANIVSNTNEDGKGIISFDGDVTSIPRSAFDRCKILMSLSMPNSVSEIGAGAFQYCSSLASIKLSENLTSIYRFAFTSCPIKTITLPESLEYVEELNIFWRCSELEAIYGNIASEDNRCLIINNELLAFAPGGLTSYTIPEGVTAIQEYAFYESELAEINLPTTLKTIYGHAFAHCHNLQTVVIPNSVEDIHSHVFYYCSSLTSFQGKFTSEDNKCLIVNGTVVAYAYPGIKEYTIPEGVTSIETCTFSGYNYTLETIHFPSTLLTIGQEAFERCHALKDVVIPPSVTEIKKYAFQWCPAMNSITIQAVSPPVLGQDAFYDTGDAPIYVPGGSLEAYKTAAIWSSYADRIQAIPDSTVPEAVDLGLPSGLKWASCNVGANAPEEYGDYFAWGDPEPYYTEGHSQDDPCSNWKANKTGYYWTHCPFRTSGEWEETQFSKYNTSSANGPIDNNTVLYPDDDAAHVNWGGSWRMPTYQEWTELIDECTWAWTTQTGVQGYLVTGPNGNSIFLPAAGCRSGADLNIAWSDGYYWSSSLNMENPSYTYGLYFRSNNVYGYSHNRYYGLSVRPVTDDGVRVSVTNISLNQNSITLAQGGAAALTAAITPSNATQPAVIWSSSNSSVATVDYKGVVIAVSEGFATITATTYDGGYNATCSVTVSATTSGEINGYEYIDLGLTSGLKWANCNVGATAPEEYGDYFAWGDTEPYYEEGHSHDSPCSSWENNKTGYNWESYKLCNGSYDTQIKYCTNSSYGTVDNNTVLDPDDDAAHVNWGGSWRMPTDAEWTELRTECTWIWAVKNGVYGRFVTGPNGNGIFLPAAGYRYNTSPYNTGYSGNYWSSFLNTGSPSSSYGVSFNSGNVYRGYRPRSDGQSVRPVTE